MGADTILFLSVIFPTFSGLHKFGYFLTIVTCMPQQEGGKFWDFGFAQSFQEQEFRPIVPSQNGDHFCLSPVKNPSRQKILKL